MAFADIEHSRAARGSRRSGLQLLHGYFERQARRSPHAPAVECVGETLTYQELDRYANQIAHALHERGVEAGDFVGIFLEKSPRLYAALLGVLKAGAAYVPLAPSYPSDRVAAILEDCNAATVISESATWGGLQPVIGRSTILLDRDGEYVAEQPTVGLSSDEVEFDPSNLCYVIYTSGSTGAPKGVMIEHRNVATFIEGMRATYDIGAHDRIYQGFTVAFDASVEEIWAALATGGTLVVPSDEVARSPVDAAQFIAANRVTYFSTIPTFLSMIEAELPTVRTLVLGGEPCTEELVKRWSKPWRRMLNTYGPTEATVVTTLAECSPARPVTIGHALPGYSTYVLDREGKQVEDGGIGELYIGGGAVARGYMNAADLTNDRFVENPFGGPFDRLYRTGDQVLRLDSGELQFVGRIDGQIKIRGFRVELSEIEAVLLQQTGIRAAAVNVALTDRGKDLAAYVVVDDSVALDRSAIAEALRQRLPDYMVPKYLEILDALPLCGSGKINRKALPPAVSPLKGNVVATEQPADELERKIAETWERALGVPVSVTADFFIDLGGHSLTASKTASLLRGVLVDSNVSVRDLYRQRTVRGLATSLKARGVRIAPDGGVEGNGKDSAPTASELAFASVAPFTRYCVVGLQAVSLLAYYAIVSAPLAYVVLMTMAVIDQQISFADATWISTIVGFAVWPSMLAFTILLKWLVIGRYRPGRYPVWSFYYFRWWLVTRFQGLGWAEMFNGTPLMSLYYRAMGARIGKHVTLSTALCGAFDMISIGDEASIGLETHVLGYRVEDGMLIIAPVSIGRECFVGMHCSLGLDVTMQDGSRLDDMSSLDDGTTLEEKEARRGSPATPADVSVPEPDASGRKPRTFLFGALHLALIYVMGYFLIATVLPGAALIVAALYYGGPWYGVGAAFAAVPVSIVSYMLGAVVMKRVFIGRPRAGTVRLDSLQYVRHWFTTYLLENTRHILMPLYATIYLPWFLRRLGAKIGHGTEISTVVHITPDHLQIGDGSFLADACLIGGSRIHSGVMRTGPVEIGEKSFIGNSALIPGDTRIEDNVLIGVSSTPPGATVPANTSWLGSPGFELPRQPNACCFPESTTFTPTASMQRQRAVIDAVRVLTPGLIYMALAVVMASGLVAGWYHLPLWATIALVPFGGLGLSCVAIGLVALIKSLCVGTMVPTTRPLWSRFVWINEYVNGVYEGVAAEIMSPLMGTPFIAPCLRAMGCTVGKHAFIETTLFSEFDLVNIGSYASLNMGSNVQTHLFEDRIFKADILHIGDGCSVGNMAVVLYDTEMHAGSTLAPLSVLMKGEQLPAGTRWRGIPCERDDGKIAQGAPAEDAGTHVPEAA